jgi:hypothetical protein
MIYKKKIHKLLILMDVNNISKKKIIDDLYYINFQSNCEFYKIR